jgi:uncharacterized protein
MDLLSVVLSCLVQSLLVLLLVFLVWVGHALLSLALKKTRHGFRRWCGLVGTGRSTVELVGIVVVAAFTGALLTSVAYLAIPGQAEFVGSVHSPAVKYGALGSPLLIVVAVLAYGFVGTGFWEELFFRGVIARRLIAWFGFWPGNVVQALFFAGMHIALLLIALPGTPLGLHIFTFVWTMAVSMASAGYNEKRAGGSIVGSWLFHGGVNVGTVLANLMLLQGAS